MGGVFLRAWWWRYGDMIENTGIMDCANDIDLGEGRHYNMSIRDLGSNIQFQFGDGST